MLPRGKITPMADHNCLPECVAWTGTARCHCSACGETFTSISGFDLHRSGSRDRRFKQGECSDPAERGLVLNDRGYWRSPGERDYDDIFGR